MSTRYTTSAGKAPRKQPYVFEQDEESFCDEVAASFVTRPFDQVDIPKHVQKPLRKKAYTLDHIMNGTIATKQEDGSYLIGTADFDEQSFCRFCLENSTGMTRNETIGLYQCNECGKLEPIHMVCSGCEYKDESGNPVEVAMTSDVIGITTEMAQRLPHVFCSQECLAKVSHSFSDLVVYVPLFESCVTMSIQMFSNSDHIVSNILEKVAQLKPDAFVDDNDRDPLRWNLHFSFAPTYKLYRDVSLMIAFGSELKSIPLIMLREDMYAEDLEHLTQHTLLRCIPDDFEASEAEFVWTVENTTEATFGNINIYTGECVAPEQDVAMVHDAVVEAALEADPIPVKSVYDGWLLEEVKQWLLEHGHIKVPEPGAPLWPEPAAFDGSRVIIQLPESVYQTLLKNGIRIPTNNVSGVRRGNSNDISKHTRFVVIYKNVDQDHWYDSLYSQIYSWLSVDPKAFVCRKRGTPKPDIKPDTLRPLEQRQFDADVPWSWLEIFTELQARDLLSAIAPVSQDQQRVHFLSFLRELGVQRAIPKDVGSNAIVCKHSRILFPLSCRFKAAIGVYLYNGYYWNLFNLSGTSFSTPRVQKSFNAISLDDKKTAFVYDMINDLTTDDAQVSRYCGKGKEEESASESDLEARHELANSMGASVPVVQVSILDTPRSHGKQCSLDVADVARNLAPIPAPAPVQAKRTLFPNTIMEQNIIMETEQISRSVWKCTMETESSVTIVEKPIEEGEEESQDVGKKRSVFNTAFKKGKKKQKLTRIERDALKIQKEGKKRSSKKITKYSSANL